jgi:hypothetical protein
VADLFFLDHAQKLDPSGQGQKLDFMWTHNPKSPFSGLGKVACRIALSPKSGFSLVQTTKTFFRVFLCSLYYLVNASPTPPQPRAGQDHLPQVEKKGSQFLAGQPPRLSYWPWWVESKGAAGIPRQPIISCFIGYLLLPVGCAGEAQRQSRRNAGGAKAGW